MLLHSLFAFAGAITYRETALLIDANNSSAAVMQRVARTVCHEIAHMWSAANAHHQHLRWLALALPARRKSIVILPAPLTVSRVLSSVFLTQVWQSGQSHRERRTLLRSALTRSECTAQVSEFCCSPVFADAALALLSFPFPCESNQVTMEWWSYLWLNEGFARFMEHLAVDHMSVDTSPSAAQPLQKGTHARVEKRTSSHLSCPFCFCRFFFVV